MPYIDASVNWAIIGSGNGLSLVRAKPLSEPMLVYCQLDPWEQVSVKFESEFYPFHSRKCIWKCRLPKWWPFCPGEDDLTGNKCRTNHFFFSQIVTDWCRMLTQEVRLPKTSKSNLVKFCWIKQFIQSWHCGISPLWLCALLVVVLISARVKPASFHRWRLVFKHTLLVQAGTYPNCEYKIAHK